MNRFKKEEARKGKNTREGLSELEIKQLDMERDFESEIASLTGTIHAEMFPEEYDHRLDSIFDANDRSKGINPMNAEYIAKVAARREALGIAPLSSSGMPTNNDSHKLARIEAESRLRGKES